MLKAWQAGDGQALEQLTPVVYAELHRIARRHMAGERAGHVLQPSALVNEVFLRLVRGTDVELANRNQFYALSAKLMRRILIDFARAQEASKRGHRAPHLAITGIRELAGPNLFMREEEFLALDAALSQLAELEPRQAAVVELRFFGGLENGEIANLLQVSEPTVVRDWRFARAWLFQALRSRI
jgi:RNA polymerase sigma factor (TIGR02999 family)